MQITFLARKSALIYRRGLRQRVASLTIDCNGVFAISAYRLHIGVILQLECVAAFTSLHSCRPLPISCQEKIGCRTTSQIYVFCFESISSYVNDTFSHLNMLVLVPYGRQFNYISI